MSTGSGPFTYEWNFGDGGTSSSANPSYTYAAAGTYIVCLKTLVNSNCWSRSCHKLIVSTLSANSSCTALPDTPAYRLAPLFIEENKMELVAEESSQNNVLMARQPKDGAEPLLAGKLNLFPNPASQVVQAVFVAAVNTTAEVMVMNASGKLVYKKVIPAVNGKNQLAIPVQKLPNGIYLVRIKTGDQALSGNFFVDNR